MRDSSWTVVKVGGSLFAWPELGGKLRAWLAALAGENVLLIPGGGATADAIRALDRTHQLGEEASHWLALEALSLNARFLHRLLPEARIVTDFAASGLAILDPAPFFQADERRPDHLPHSWQVTSDSLAVRAAVLAQARALILLKSVAWAGDDWHAARRAGVVDGYFADALTQAHAEMCVRVVNLRCKG
jgi:5-(aminomethyl)-3-furanmethanol phosphate kinase